MGRASLLPSQLSTRVISCNRKVLQIAHIYWLAGEEHNLVELRQICQEVINTWPLGRPPALCSL